LTDKNSEYPTPAQNNKHKPMALPEGATKPMEIQQLNLNTVILQLDDDFGRTSASVSHINAFLLEHFGQRIINTVPAYRSLLIEFSLQHHAMAASTAELEQQVRAALSHFQADTAERRIVEIPVYYHPSVGDDLEQIMESKNISLAQLIELHTRIQYQVQAVGFIPGFAYLGNLEPALQVSRLARPRATVAKGSIAIAEQQTAVYPRATPGGWNIIGRTPIDVFHITAEGEIAHAFELGDTVQFRSISEADFFALGGRLGQSGQNDRYSQRDESLKP
jgi:Allophanate hydrolase subunit 1